MNYIGRVVLVPAKVGGAGWGRARAHRNYIGRVGLVAAMVGGGGRNMEGTWSGRVVGIQGPGPEPKHSPASQ